MMTFSTMSEAPDRKLIPTSPDPGLPCAFCAALPAPLIVSPRRMTLIEFGNPLPESLMLKPWVADARTEPNVPLQSIVIDLVIVSVPKPPGSRQSISPPAAVLEIAPAKVLQGAVRLHGLTSSPTPETHVRVAWACAGVT